MRNINLAILISQIHTVPSLTKITELDEGDGEPALTGSDDWNLDVPPDFDDECFDPNHNGGRKHIKPHWSKGRW